MFFKHLKVIESSPQLNIVQSNRTLVLQTNFYSVNFQDQLLENVIDDDNKKDENVDKVMLWTTELLENEKIIEIMINAILKKNKKLFTRGKKINDWC